MTVTKGKPHYSFPVNSGNNSDVESLHLSSTSISDAESLHNEGRPRTRPFVSADVGYLTAKEPDLRKPCSRKKIRRYQNRCHLQTLAEEEETDPFVIVEPCPSRFRELLEDEDALKFWNDFIDKPEEEQAQILADFGTKKERKQVEKDKPVAKISSRLKRTLKIKKNLPWEHVKKCEDDLIAFFKNTPSQVYTQTSSTYFERLLLHAIAQYHGLQSLGIVECDIKRVEVYNTFKNWVPADSCLADFVTQFRK